MKSNLTTWTLFIGVLLLGGFILLFEHDRENSSQRQQRTRTVFGVYAESIKQILFERDGKNIECTKIGGIWRLTQPINAPVNVGLIEKMIAAMARVERGELISAKTLSERDLSSEDYGFNTPQARITFQNNRGTFTWLIGRDAPLGETLYVMSDDNKDIISAPRALLNLIPKNPASIRDRTLFNGEVTAIHGLDLHRKSGFLQLRQSGNLQWKMQQPNAGRADQQAVHELIEDIFSEKINRFITDEKVDFSVYGLKYPAIELILFTPEPEQIQSVQIGKPTPDKPEERYAKRVDNDSVFTVSSEWIEKLYIPSSHLRSRHLTELKPSRIRSIQIHRGAQQVELIKTNDQWQIVRPVRWDTDPKRVQELLTTLTDTSIEQFIDTPTPDQSARVKNTLWKTVLSDGEKKCILRISAPGTNDLRLTQYDGEPSLYAISSEIVRKSFADPLFYRDRTVLKINPATIKKIIVRSNEMEESVEKSDTGTFHSVSDRPIHTKGLTELLCALNHLQTERYVAFNPKNLSAYGLDQPQTELTILLNETNSIGHILLIGNTTDDGRFVMIQGQNIVFTLPEKTVQTLIQKWIKGDSLS